MGCHLDVPDSGTTSAKPGPVGLEKEVLLFLVSGPRFSGDSPGMPLKALPVIFEVGNRVFAPTKHEAAPCA